MCLVYTVQCKTYNNTIHPRSICIVPAHAHTESNIVYVRLGSQLPSTTIRLAFFLFNISSHCGYANIVSISVHTRAHIW